MATAQTRRTQRTQRTQGSRPRAAGTSRAAAAPRNGASPRRARPAPDRDAMEGMEGGEPKYHERALLRGLQILTAFTVDQPEHDLGSLSAALDLSKATLVRLLDCLKFAGFVDADPRTGAYRLGLRAFEVGSVYQQTATLDRIGRPVLTRLAQSTGQSTNLAVLDRWQVVHVSVVPSPRPIRYEGYVGLREDAYCTGLGKVLLAALPEDALEAYLRQVTFRARTPNTITDAERLRRELTEVSRRGYAIDDEEVSPGLRCVAAPVRSAAGAIVAAVSASGPKAEFEGAGLQSLVESVTAAATELGARLGATSSTPTGRLV